MGTTTKTTHSVSDVMTTDVIKIGEDDAIHTALDLMSEHRISALPVVDMQDRCVGILSMTDLMDLTKALDMTFDEGDGDTKNHVWACSILRDQFGSEIVSSIMTKEVHVLTSDTTVREAAGLMWRDRTHHVPIVDSHGLIQGMLSTFDLVKVLAE